MKEDTIAAPATLPGESAIGIIRISGPSVIKTLKKVFTFRSGKKSFSSPKPGVLSLGIIHSKGSPVDEVMLCFFKGPRSYTGEDMAEITFHGSPLIMNKIMSLLSENGCRPAGPGEFTKRAFLNSKMDLSQAEAVAGLISAKNETALNLSLKQLMGSEKKLISSVKAEILKILSLVEAEIDFAHEDIEKTPVTQVKSMLESVLKKTRRLIKNAAEGIKLKNSIRIAITGRPNAGKSSLLNRFLEKEKAIVTPVAGTTRDIIEETVTIDGFPFTFLDTAGVRNTLNEIELEGMKRAEKAVDESDLVIFVADGSEPLSAADSDTYAPVRKKSHVIAVNKSDLPSAFSDNELKNFLNCPGAAVIRVSALKNRAIKTLTKTAKDIIIKENSFEPGSSVQVTSIRHKKCLEKSAKSLESAVKAASQNGEYELIAADINRAVSEISMITGEITPENVLDDIFNTFCIGK